MRTCPRRFGQVGRRRAAIYMFPGNPASGWWNRVEQGSGGAGSCEQLRGREEPSEAAGWKKISCTAPTGQHVQKPSPGTFLHCCAPYVGGQ